jgi:hypothetical protein
VIVTVGDPPFPAALTEAGTMLAKMEHVWHAARRYAKRHGHRYDQSYGVVDVAPT